MRQAQNLIASDYENESWNEFEQIRTLVNVVYVNPEAFQAEVDAACTQLEEALNGLRLIPADTAALESLIEQTKALNPEDYVSFEDVQAILDSAKDGLPEKQSEVDAMKNSLQQALDALRRIDDPEQTLDYSLLEKLCTKAETLDLGAFKQAGKDEFSAALQAGKNLVSHAQSQSQIDQAADTLHTSLLALRKTPSAASLGL